MDLSSSDITEWFGVCIQVDSDGIKVRTVYIPTPNQDNVSSESCIPSPELLEEYKNSSTTQSITAEHTSIKKSSGPLPADYVLKRHVQTLIHFPPWFCRAISSNNCIGLKIKEVEEGDICLCAASATVYYIPVSSGTRTTLAVR